MKILKFRAWEKDEKKWLDKDELFISVFKNELHGWQKDENWEITESTRLYDCDMKEIFRGDIMSTKEDWSHNLEANYKRIGVVKYCEGFGREDTGYYLHGWEYKDNEKWREFKNDLKKAQYGLDGNYNTKPISNGGWVIGNIYEHPELLGGRK